MSNLNENLRIVSVREMMVERLAIPNYQRPYRWGTQSALRLITDTYEAFKNRIPEYRMGSVVLHREKHKMTHLLNLILSTASSA